MRNEKKDHLMLWENGERAALIQENNYFHEHYKHILENDAVLIMNGKKHDIENYIGGNVLMKIRQVYVN